MGVPKFFRYMSERYPCLGELIRDHQIPEFDNLYLDMNGIIHVCSHPNDFDPHFRISEENIFNDIFHYLELLFGMIKPKKLFFMAVDGVAPRAKMNQQRGRRFRSAKEAEMLEKKATDMGQTLPEAARFDSNCITPGTVFMVKLHEQLKYFITKKISEDPLWQKCTVILSGHETPGEGEHKIMDYIRYMKSQPDYDATTRHCLYGLDADLIMLGLCSHEPHFSLLREEVKFGKQAKRQTAAQGVRFFLLHLSLMREYLDLEFQSLKSTLPFPYDLESIIDDWVLLSFLVGNDFIPNVPDMHIASGALPVLYKAYKDVLPTLDGYINEQGTLNLARFRKFMEKLAAFDISQFKETYADLKYFEAKTGRKMNSKLKPFDMDDDENPDKEESSKPNVSKNQELADLIKATDDLYNEDALEEEKEDVFQEVDYDFGEDSEDDDPVAFMTEFHQHKRNYYVEKMEYDEVTADVLSGQAEGYVRAVQWNLHYYYNGVASWSWYYPHHYAPYLSDICRFKDIDLTFDMGKPFHPFEQLLGVLPAASKSLLPEPYRWLMCESTSPIIEYYPEDFRTDLNGKAQDWEAVVLIPFISEGRLLEAMAPCYEKLTPEEKARNKFGPMLIYNYTNESSGMYEAPEFFPAVESNLTKVDEMWYDDVQLEKSKLIKGVLPGAKLNLFFPGFPTLQHIPFKAKLKKANVAVFESMNRNESMILSFTDSWLEKLSNLSEIAKEYIGKEVYVDYPHLHEARIVAVADNKTRYDINKDPKVSAEYTMTKLKDMASHQVEAEGATITNEYMRKRGIEIGKTEVVVYACPMEGKRGVVRNGKMCFEKQFVPTASQYALQTIVKDIKVYEPNEETVTVDDVFAPGSTCFMLAQPYYGSCGKVLDADDIKPGRINVEMVLTEQPNFDQVREKLVANDIYYAAQQAAHHVGMNTLLLTRITGTVLLKSGTKDSKEVNHNIGLNLKSTKQNLMVPGYTRRNNGVWLYSTLVLNDLELYMDTFPDVFEKLSLSVGSDLKVEDVFPGPDGSKKVATIKKFLQGLPCSKVERASCESEILPAAVVEDVEKTVDLYLKSKSSTKCGVLQVKPTTLYKSKLSSGNIAPDPKADHMLFDRVVVVRDDFIVPMGYKGTIIGIHKSEKPGDNRYDVLFDKSFPGSVSISNSSKRAFRVAQSKFINITYGLRQACKNVNTQGRLFGVNDVNSKRPSAFTSFNPNKQQNTNNTIHNWRQDCGPLHAKGQSQRNGAAQEKKTTLWRDPSSNPLLQGPEWFKFPPPPNARTDPAPKQNKYPDVWAQLQGSKILPSSNIAEPKQFSVPPPASALPVPAAVEKEKAPPCNPGDRNYKPQSVRIAKKNDEDQMSNALKQMLRISSNSHSNSKPVLVSDMMAKAAAAAAASCSSPASTGPSRDPLRPVKKRQAAMLSSHQPSPAKESPESSAAKAPAKPPAKPPAKTSAVNVNELLSYYQSKGLGIPQFHFTESGGNLVQANVTLPDQRRVTSGLCKGKQEAAESAAGAALSVLKQDGSSADKVPSCEPPRANEELGKDQKNAAEDNLSFHPGTLFQHFRTSAQNPQDVTLRPGNICPPMPGRFPYPSVPPNPVSPNKMNYWRGPQQNVYIHRPHAQRQDGPMPRKVQPFDMNNFFRGPSPPVRFNSVNMPYGSPGNWQHVRPFQPPQPHQQHWQQQQPHWQQQQWHQQLHPQQLLHQQPSSENPPTHKITDGIAFVPLQAVKQQRNAKSAALLRREHLNSQDSNQQQDESLSRETGQGHTAQASQPSEEETKEQLPKNGVKPGTVEQSASTDQKTSIKSDDSKKADLPSRPESQVRRSRLAARFGPTGT